MIGTVLGSYRITGELSRGGMGAVFAARHELLDRPAAVKLLRPELTENDELVERFINEAKAATAIRHPGIVEVFDFGYTEDGRAYLVMELLDGKPLSKAIEHVGRFAEHEAIAIARGIASALKAAHARGIVHRDLKPDNIFLVPDLDGPTGGQRAKVLDFGIAKLADRLPGARHHTQTGALIGTPMYMAPEQARAASAIDHRADLYSLGCVLYEMLVGQPPFVAEGAGELIAMQLFSEPEPPRTRVPDLSPEIEQIVMKLLAKEPDDRFQSAGELATVLGGGRPSFDLVAASSPQLPIASAASVASVAAAGSAAESAAGSVRDVPAATEPGHELPPRRSSGSAMPIVAGVLTLAIAGAVAIVVATRGGDEAVPAPAPAPVRAAVPDPAPAPPAPAPSPPTPARPREITVVEDKPAIVRTPPRRTMPTRRTIRRRGPTTEAGAPYELDIGPDVHEKKKP